MLSSCIYLSITNYLNQKYISFCYISTKQYMIEYLDSRHGVVFLLILLFRLSVILLMNFILNLAFVLYHQILLCFNLFQFRLAGIMLRNWHNYFNFLIRILCRFYPFQVLHFLGLFHMLLLNFFNILILCLLCVKYDREVRF